MLEDFLKAKSGSGRLDSEGAFTLAEREARRKLSLHGLDGPENVLLRIIQHCVACGAEEIEVSLGREEVTLWGRRLQGDSFLLSDLDEPLPTLLLACLHAGFSRGIFRNPHRSWSLEDGRLTASASRAEAAIKGHLLLRLTRQQPEGFWSRLRQNLRGRGADFLTLRSRTAFSPVPVRLDGRAGAPWLPRRARAFELSLLGPAGLKREGIAPPWSHSKAALTIRRAAERRSYSDDFDVFGKESVAAAPRFFNPSLPSWWKGKVSNDSVLAQLYAYSKPAHESGVLTFVRDGCTVGEVPWPQPVGVHGVISAVGLDVDLSGLRLVMNRKVEELLDYLVALARESARGMLRHWPEGREAEVLTAVVLGGRESV